MEIVKKPRTHRPVRWRWRALAGVIAFTCLGASIGDVLYVNRVALPIRSGKFAFNKVLSTAVQGETVTVTGVDGDWLKVKYTPKSDPGSPQPTVEGYVVEDALNARQVSAATIAPTGGATDVAAAGAARGVLVDSGKYAIAKGLTPDAFYRMMTDSRDSMNDTLFDEFTKAAHIGPYKPKAVAQSN